MLSDLSFHPCTTRDLSDLRMWLAEEEVTRWYASTDHLETIQAHMYSQHVTPLIARENGKPLGYIQHYDIHAFGDHPLGFLPMGARGMDCFIGCPTARGRGLGHRMVAQLSRSLFLDGVPALGLDPLVKNTRAIACYAKAGFRQHGVTETADGTTALMVRFRDDQT